MILNGQAETEHAGRYVQQLCKHWSHKFEVEADTDQGHIHLPIGEVFLRAADHSLDIELKPQEAASADKLKQVVVDHIDRFAHKEGGLSYRWTAE